MTLIHLHLMLRNHNNIFLRAIKTLLIIILKKKPLKNLKKINSNLK